MSFIYGREEMMADYEDSENSIVQAMASCFEPVRSEKDSCTSRSRKITTSAKNNSSVLSIAPYEPAGTFAFNSLPTEIRQKALSYLLPAHHAKYLNLFWTSRGVYHWNHLDLLWLYSATSDPKSCKESRNDIASISSVSVLVRQDFMAVVAARCIVTISVDKICKLGKAFELMPFGLACVLKRLEIVLVRGTRVGEEVLEEIWHEIHGAGAGQLNRLKVTFPGEPSVGIPQEMNENVGQIEMRQGGKEARWSGRVNVENVEYSLFMQ